MLRRLIAALPRGRARAARAVRHLRRHSFLDVVEPRALDVRMWVDPADPFQLEVWTGAYQPHVVQWLRESVKPADRVVCVGLHVGYVAGLARRLAGPTGRVISAEPDATARRVAERSLALGDTRDAPIAIFPGGFDQAEGMLTLNHSRVMGHSSFACPHQGDGPESVPVTTGDAFLAAHGIERLDVLVLDVEGWELRVLIGLADTIARSPRIRMCVELAPWALREAGTDERAVRTWLFERGVSLNHLHGDDWATRALER